MIFSAIAAVLLNAAGLPPAVRVKAIEQLYATAILLDPVEVAKDGYSHADILRDLVQAREAAGPEVPWHVVTLSPVKRSAMAAEDEVAVRVVVDKKALEGAEMHFNKAPHMSCVARVRKDGFAGCKLVDQHGHDEEHSEHDSEPVVATFPGFVRADRILPPTTLVMKR